MIARDRLDHEKPERVERPRTLRIYHGVPPAYVAASRALRIDAFAPSTDAEGTQALGAAWKSAESRSADVDFGTRYIR